MPRTTVQRIDEEDETGPVPGLEDDSAPLLGEDGEIVNSSTRPFMKGSRRVPVLSVIALSLIFVLSLTTVFFGSLYFKLRHDVGSLPNLHVTFQNAARVVDWPKASQSLLGNYSTAAVAADNELCSDIGRDILLKGGNAVEAAIAALFCIGVMDTQSAGIGGGHFMTIYNATTKKCHVVDAREVAPLKASRDMFKDRWDNARIGWEAVAVPGELHGLWTEYQNFGGNLEWSALVKPTIELMKSGYPTSHALAHALEVNKEHVLNETTMRKHFVNPKTGKLYKVGEQIETREAFIRTLESLAISKDPIQDFYNGTLTDKMVEEFVSNGGIITKEDFQKYSSIVRPAEEIITVSLGGGVVACGPPPPSSAAVTLSILGITEGFKRDTKTAKGLTETFHHFIEASKFAYAQRSALGDIAFEKDALELARNMTTDEWFDRIHNLIDDDTHPDEYYGGKFQLAAPDHGTTHISIIDKWGNAISTTSTINLLLGAQVVSESTGILWNDEMDDFSLPGHPNYFNIPPSPSNYIKPGKRPQSSMSPLVIFDRTGRRVLSLGGAGGSTIISGVAGVAMHVIQMGRNVKEAVDYPRLHNQLRPNVTYAEAAWPKQYLTELEKRGHEFQSVEKVTVVTAVEKYGRRITANSDYRKGTESEPAGY